MCGKLPGTLAVLAVLSSRSPSPFDPQRHKRLCNRKQRGGLGMRLVTVTQLGSISKYL